ncbi:MAG: PAS domain S-box protein [Chloroflexota bacterium]|nr:PAS domain S-box protein [Dehalococcoidia bacterium]MDW8253690.1 PAS domain S-box protein [Chloroflexota bacterium]
MSARSLSLASDQLLASLPVAALVVNDVGDILLANRAAAALFEYEEGALLGQPLRHLFPSGLRLGDEVISGRYVAVSATGAILPVRVWARPVEHECLQMILVEPLAPEAPSEYQRAFRAAASGVVFVSRDGRILEANPTFCEITGYREDELRGMSVQDLSHPDDRRAESAGIQQLEAGELQSFSIEKRYRRKDGRTIWVQLEIALVRPEQGEPGYCIAQVIDITARKEAALRVAAFQAATRALETMNDLDTALHVAFGQIAGVAGWRRCELWEQGERGPACRVVWAASPETETAPTPTEVVAAAFHSSEEAGVALAEEERSGWVVLPLFEGERPFAVLVAHGAGEAPDPAFRTMVLDFGHLLRQVLERRRAEQTLQLFARAIDSTADGVLILDATRPELPVLSANPAACRITGFSPEELVGRSVALLHGETPDADIPQSVWEAVREGRDARLLLRHQRRDGAIAWNDLTLSPIRDERGQVRHVVAILHDITDRVEVERQLRESEALLAEAQAIAHIGSWEYDLRTHILNGTAEVWRLLGVDDLPEADRSREASRRLDHAAFRDAVERALASGEAVTFDQRIAIPRRYVRYLRIVLRPVVDGEGRPVRVRGTMMDVTEMRLAEQALRESEALQRSIVENLDEGIIVGDATGAFRVCNASAERITGLTAAQLARRSPVPPGWRVIREDGTLFPLEEQPGPRALETGLPQCNVVAGFVRPSGETTWCEVNAQPLFRPGERRPHLVVVSLRDITESRRAAAELRATNEELTRQVAALEQRTREISLLAEMGELLASCQTTEDAYVIIAELAGTLFPGSRGKVALLEDSAQAELLSAWGDQTVGQPFARGDCWALRRGRPHIVRDSRVGLICPHLRDRLPASYLCIPLIAQDEVLGIFHLAQETGTLGEGQQQLAVTVAEHIALALANLRLRERLRHQSVRDPLTDLFNRRYLEEALRLEERRAARSARGLALMMLDIDHFKSFNDQFGHDAGDLVLREFGKLLRSQIRGGDIACRFGGEEFTLILPEISARDARTRAEHLRAAVAAMRLTFRGQPLGALTCSIGVAVFPDHAATIEECLSAADRALYRAKALGRNRVVLAGEGETPQP